MRQLTWAGVMTLLLASPGVCHAQSAPEGRMLKGAKIYKILSHDAIPSINDPRFTSADSARAFMEEHELVLGVTDGTTAKCYSTWALESHELVNDWLGDVPISAEW
jgi:hypothetical protein